MARLLLVHGRWSYYRISLLMYYFFYKNNIIALLQFIYAVYNGNSGQTFYDSGNQYLQEFSFIFLSQWTFVQYCVYFDSYNYRGCFG